jgi:ferredoxin
MRTRVDVERCQGHGLCHWTAPEVFAPDDDDGHAVVQVETVPPELEAAVRDAAANCPESAIELLES